MKMISDTIKNTVSVNQLALLVILLSSVGLGWPLIAKMPKEASERTFPFIGGKTSEDTLMQVKLRKSSVPQAVSAIRETFMDAIGPLEKHSASEKRSRMQSTLVAKHHGAPGPNLKKTHIGAMIVEQRCHVALPLVVWNMRKNLPSLPIQMFYSDANEACVLGWFGHMEKMTLTKLKSTFWRGSHSNQDISWLFTTAAFWDKVQHEKVLYFQQDSWVCNNAEAKLEHFLQYDYVGAPWPANNVPQCNGVGNGGFSLRTVKVMREICARYGRSTENEDVYFCGHLNGWKSVDIPSSGVAGDFSAELFDGSHNHSPVGIHQAYRFDWFRNDITLRQNCPGLESLGAANDMNHRYEGSNEEAIKKGFEIVRLVEKDDEFEKDKEHDIGVSQLDSGAGLVFAVTIKRHKHSIGQ